MKLIEETRGDRGLLRATAIRDERSLKRPAKMPGETTMPAAAKQGAP
jgi:hypothetical protein